MGYTLNVGPECEFFLFHTDDDGQPTTISHEKAGYFDLGACNAHALFYARRRIRCRPYSLRLPAAEARIRRTAVRVPHPPLQIQRPIPWRCTAAWRTCLLYTSTLPKSRKSSQLVSRKALKNFFQNPICYLPETFPVD